jgi:glycerate kinase
MKILIAPDKFKGSLSARGVAENIAIGLRDVLPDASIKMLPIADGGEGTVIAIHEAAGGEWIDCLSHDALGRPVEARYSWLSDRATAVMEMSEAAGLWRIALEERDLVRANTYGVGEMISHAAEHGARQIVIGLGGSATNDGGFGMARGLGFKFFGIEHPPPQGYGVASEHEHDYELETVLQLAGLTQIVRPHKTFPKITSAVDVRNPLLGQRGATRTFGPQKGGTPEQLEMLEKALLRLADTVARDLGCDWRDAPGAGAAGGLGFGLMSFCGAQIESGFDVVSGFTGLPNAISESDVVITGEGRVDEQTLEGKAPSGVARLARQSGKRVFAIAGSVTESPALRDLFDGVMALARPPITPQESIARAAELLQERARELARML